MTQPMNAFDKAIARALDEKIVATPATDRRHQVKVWIAKSSTVANRYHIVSLNPVTDEWQCTCPATVPCRHIGAAFVAKLSAEAKQIKHEQFMAQVRENAPMLRHDNQGPRLFR